MDIKKTLILSSTLHIIVFSAALMFSAELIRGSRNIHNHNTVFVNIVTGGEQSDAVKVNKKKLNKSVIHHKQKKIKKPRIALVKKQESDLAGAFKMESVETESIRPAKQVLLASTASDVNMKKDILKNLVKADIDQDSFIPENSADFEMDYGYDESDEASFDVQDEVYHEISTGNTAMISKGYGLSKTESEGALHAGLIHSISMAIERVKSYPVMARKKGMEGTVYIGFNITKSGQPKDIRILQSSGFALLDTSTINVVKKAAPYPNINIPVEVPVVYKLENK